MSRSDFFCVCVCSSETRVTVVVFFNERMCSHSSGVYPVYKYMNYPFKERQDNFQPECFIFIHIKDQNELFISTKIENGCKKTFCFPFSAWSCLLQPFTIKINKLTDVCTVLVLLLKCIMSFKIFNSG